MVQNTLTQLEVSPETTSTSNTPFDCLAVEGVAGAMDSQSMATHSGQGIPRGNPDQMGITNDKATRQEQCNEGLKARIHDAQTDRTRTESNPAPQPGGCREDIHTTTTGFTAR